MRKGGSKWNERDMSRGRRGEGGVPRRKKDEYQKQRGVYLERVPKKVEGGILGCWPEPL